MADVAASITALITVAVSTFKACVELYQLVSAARHAGQEMLKVRRLIEWEEYRFIQWGDRIGLTKDENTCDPYLPWPLIQDTLDQLQSLFSDTKRLQERYGLARDAVVSPEEEVPVDGNEAERSGITKMWTYVGSEVQKIRARTERHLHQAKRFRWVAVDQTKIRHLVTDLGRFNDRLSELLASQDQSFIHEALTALLQDLVARTSRSSDLDTLKVLTNPDWDTKTRAIEAAAEVKRVRMYLQLDRRPGEQPGILSTKPKVPKVEFSKVKDATSGHYRQVAIYKSSKRQINSLILLDWKHVPKQVEKKLQQRVEGLTFLLSSANDPSFSTLRCIGYTRREHETESYNSFAYAFELFPVADAGDDPAAIRTHDLASLVRGARRLTSLSVRAGYARRIARAVLQFHIAGWLHKAIRPSNLIFVQQADGSPVKGPYVIGFSHSRADNALEMTEDPTGDRSGDLYSHPDLLGVNRPSFCKMFDLYSLGCVLIEIALWKPLYRVLDDVAHDGKRKGVLAVVDSLTELVAFSAGDNFAQAVSLCLRPQQPKLLAADDTTEEGDDLESSVHNQVEVVRLLELCSC